MKGAPVAVVVERRAGLLLTHAARPQVDLLVRLQRLHAAERLAARRALRPSLFSLFLHRFGLFLDRHAELVVRCKIPNGELRFNRLWQPRDKTGAISWAITLSTSHIWPFQFDSLSKTGGNSRAKTLGRQKSIPGPCRRGSRLRRCLPRGRLRPSCGRRGPSQSRP